MECLEPIEYGNEIELGNPRGPIFSELHEHVLLKDAWKVLGPDVPIEIRMSGLGNGPPLRICWTKNPRKKRLQEFPILIRETKTGGKQ